MTNIDFTCKVCGKECPIAPDPPERAVCEEHCEDHAFEYDPFRRGKFCIHCDKEQEYEPCEGDVPIGFSGAGMRGSDGKLGIPFSELTQKQFEQIANSWGYP
jgi:hypothetical protein